MPAVQTDLKSIPLFEVHFLFLQYISSFWNIFPHFGIYFLFLEYISYFWNISLFLEYISSPQCAESRNISIDSITLNDAIIQQS